ncbi:uncharacterized protein RJT20DRAFT_38745 [Scheffersomyces xylosifermentans]|uniref:uncharacterized protein n=1 Tax=Scheffersomyces xylosifermentans TaxID=1304137 RepID=UPI00315DA358
MFDFKIKLSLLLSLSFVLSIINASNNDRWVPDGWRLVETNVNVIFNVTLFMNCVNMTGTTINLWETESDEYLITPYNLTVFELDTWLECVDDQGIADLLVISDGLYLEGLTSIRTNIVNGTIEWEAVRGYLERTDDFDIRDCCNSTVLSSYNMME